MRVFVGAVQLPTPHRAVDLPLALHMSLLLLEEGFQLARLVLSLLQATTLMLSLEHACAWPRNTFDWCVHDNDLTSMEWVKEFLTNSCDINLVKQIDEKYDCLAEYEQGGITFLKIALDEMFTMSNMVVMSLQK